MRVSLRTLVLPILTAVVLAVPLASTPATSQVATPDVGMYNGPASAVTDVAEALR